MFRELAPVIVAGLVPIALLILIVLGTAFSLVAWQPPVLRQIQFGTAPPYNNEITSITSDSTGVYAAGFVGQSSSNLTSSHLFLNKYDQNGNLLREINFDNPYLSSISDIATGPNAEYVVGEANSTSFVRVFNPSGAQLWIDRFGAGHNAATGIAISSTGVYVGGYNGSIYYLRSYYLSGNLQWSENIGSNNGWSVHVYADSGGVYLLTPENASSELETGTSLIQRFDLNGVLLWTRTCSCDSSQTTNLAGDSSGIYVVGSAQVQGLSNGLITKFDSDGTQLWSRTFTGPGYSPVGVGGVAVDSSGAYLLTGDLVLRYDSNGNQIWTVQLPSGSRGAAITLQSGNVYVGGQTVTSTAAFLALISEQSSLIFFGINPPLSFGVTVALVLTIIGGILLFRNQLKKNRLLRPRVDSHLPSPKIQSDFLPRLS